MPTLKKIRDTMQKQKIDDKIMAQIDFEADCNNPYNLISFNFTFFIQNITSKTNKIFKCC